MSNSSAYITTNSIVIWNQLLSEYEKFSMSTKDVNVQQKSKAYFIKKYHPLHHKETEDEPLHDISENHYKLHPSNRQLSEEEKQAKVFAVNCCMPEMWWPSRRRYGSSQMQQLLSYFSCKALCRAFVCSKKESLVMPWMPVIFVLFDVLLFLYCFFTMCFLLFSYYYQCMSF